MRRLAQILCALILLWTSVPSGARPHADAAPVLFLRERQMRERARVEVLPEYPPEALKDKARGIIVAEVEFDARGNVTKVEVVDSSHLAFVRPTARALSRWKFDPITTPRLELYGGRGKLTFYFYNKNGRGWVEHPLVFKKPARAKH